MKVEGYAVNRKAVGRARLQTLGELSKEKSNNRYS